MPEPRQPHLNGAYYGPSIPPPSKAYHHPSRVCKLIHTKPQQTYQNLLRHDRRLGVLSGTAIRFGRTGELEAPIRIYGYVYLGIVVLMMDEGWRSEVDVDDGWRVEIGGGASEV
ncbi:hypothetical protein LguiB_000544 [Lonicera macranthoides]